METTSTNETIRVVPYRISWPAIFAGVIMALVVGVLLNILGLSLGLGAFEPESSTLQTLKVGGMAWLIISGVIAMIIGGWVAGNLAGYRSRRLGFIHGLLTWGLFSIISLSLMATTAGSIMSGTMGAVGKAMAMGAQGIGNLAPQMADLASDIFPDADQAVSVIKESARKTFDERGNPDGEDIDTTLQNFLEGRPGRKMEEAKSAVVDHLVKEEGMSREAAERRVTRWQRDYQEAKNQIENQIQIAKAQALETTEQASKVMAQAAAATFIAMILGAIASGLGGIWGARKA